MNLLDYVVLLGSMLAIAGYGVWRARGRHNLSDFLRTDRAVGWGTIGLSVMATQTSAITFLSTPGQAYESGLAFVQNYFGMPIALVIVAAVFVPIYRRLKVFTAYEYLGIRFDGKTRLLGAALFLLQRGLASGITIYAPAIILSTVLGWRQDLTIIATGVFVVVYTVSGGNEAVSQTQKWQMAVIFAGMVAAFGMVLYRLPSDLGLGDALSVAGTFGKLEAVDFSFNPNTRYTVWSGILGGVFLFLSYFGTDQSQVARYLSGTSVRESRLGLMFNALFKIPMQFFILLLGALVFVFYQFERPPVFFNQAAWAAHATGETGAKLRALEGDYQAAHAEKRARVTAWLQARESGDAGAEAAAQGALREAATHAEGIRQQAKATLAAADPSVKTNDADYVFITFVLQQMPHGLIGLLIALIFAAAVSSLSSELAALGETTAVDFYAHVVRPGQSDAHNVSVARWLTAMWGVVAIGFALFANVVENLIQAVNILGSIFYGPVLGIFLVAFFLKRVGGTAVFAGALAAQALVIVLFFTLKISFLWLNPIGCAACVLASVILQALWRARPGAAGPVTA
ncbi:sodium:solute symporter [Opitutus sp. ER46]|uniref:sodium:solute symporter n=1 Tax=Opitutus sp. ER46 TaxID=2161864 RepID=UPI000D3129C8|nr:sodium:solute symporter [Opitutus sp. ER46]PTX94396.1 sodium:solute symporter [Opitutus sp. ER46]